MAAYPYPEQADMIFMYGKANGNGRLACRMYQESFPNRQIPHHTTFAAVYRRLSETGTLFPSTSDRGVQRQVRTPNFDEDILTRVEEEPGVSTRKLAALLNVSHMTVWRVLHEQLLYPYHIQRVQALGPADFPLRLRFCQWFLQQAANPDFISSVLFTDEASFNRDGIINYHNNHEWAYENPHTIHQARHQVQFKINVWMGIVGDCLLGPFVLPERLNGDDYRDFLENDLPLLLEEVPLNVRNSIWFMHDGAPPHFRLHVRDFLNQTFREKWIGRGGPTPWPPRSPDLNPIDFYVWGHLKSLVYERPIATRDELRARIFDACHTIKNTPGIFERVRESMTRRINACIGSNGSHIEHLL
jgi:hypothetical protein